MSKKDTKKKNPLISSLSDNIHKKWNYTDDKVGVELKKPPVCPICSTEEDKAHMVMRWVKNEIVYKGSNYEPVEVAFKVAYKCPMCAWVAYFFVPCDHIYWTKILMIRKNVTLYYPPLEVWSSEDKKIAEQLESLGYFGGRGDL